MRNTTRFPVEGANSLWHVYKTVPFWKVVKNFIVIELARYTPFLGMKNWLYRTFLRLEGRRANLVRLNGHAGCDVS